MAITRLNPDYTPPLPYVNGWYFGFMVSGWSFVVPLATSRDVAGATVSSAQVWTPGAGWTTLTYDGVSKIGGNACLLFSTASNSGVESNRVYLVSITATLS